MKSLTLIFFLSSCDYMGLEKQILNKDEPIASLFDIKLYRKDIQNLIPKNISKEEFDKNPVLNRFEHQLKFSGLKTGNTMKPNFTWAVSNIDSIKQEFNLSKYIVLFPDKSDWSKIQVEKSTN